MYLLHQIEFLKDIIIIYIMISGLKNLIQLHSLSYKNFATKMQASST